MKKFVFRLILILLPCVIFLSYEEYKLREIPNDYSLKKSYLDENSEDITGLVMGSSLSWQGINPRYLDGNYYNAAFSGQPMKYDEFLFDRYKDNLDNIEDVVITVFYPSFEFEKNRWFRNLEKYFSIYFDYGPPTVLFNLFNGAQIKNKLKRVKENSNTFVYSDSSGFRANAPMLFGTKESKSERLAEMHTADNKNQRASNAFHLQKLAQACKEKSARLWVVVHPSYSGYRIHADKDQVQRMRGILEELARNNDNLRVLDYWENSVVPDSLFYDGLHLSNEGATHFSKILNTAIKRQ